MPVDVRVLDSNGKPVIGLAQSDFTVLEDGVKQEIRLFSAATLAPEPDARPVRRTTSPGSLTSQTRRVLLIVLGRGRLQPPSRGIDAMIRLVRERLLPQDQVALFAFNRATDFTTNHEYLATVLERFKGQHEAIEAKIRQRGFEDLAAIYGVVSIPQSAQGEIDDLFRVPGGPPLRTPPGAKVTNAERLAADERLAREALLDGAIVAERRNMGGEPGALSAASDVMLNVGFGDFVADFPRGMQDLTKLYQGIEYLRGVDGEKHLIYVTERGLSLPRLEDHSSVAAMANDARVVIDTIQTGGLPDNNFAASSATRMAPPIGAPRPITASPSPGGPMFSVFTIQSLHMVSELTGGLSSVYSPANTAVDRITAATSSSYLLGYTSSNASADGRYRRIAVQVNRRGVRTLWRHGYYATGQGQPFDRARALTYNRIASAANFAGEVRDIGLELKTSELRDRTGLRIQIDLKIDPSRLSWTVSGDDRTGTVDIAVFFANKEDALVGEHWQHVDMRLSAADFERTKTSPLSYSAAVPVKEQPTQVKVIVYDFGADLLGTMSRRLR